VTVTAAGSNGYATLAFAKLGLRTGVVAVLADDALGDVVYQEMVQGGVDVSHVVRQPHTQSGIGIYLLLFGQQEAPPDVSLSHPFSVAQSIGAGRSGFFVERPAYSLCWLFALPRDVERRLGQSYIELPRPVV